MKTVRALCATWILSTLCLAQLTHAQIFWDFTSSMEGVGTLSGSFKTTGSTAELSGTEIVSFEPLELLSLNFEGEQTLAFGLPIVGVPVGTDGFATAGQMVFDQNVQEVVYANTVLIWNSFSIEPSILTFFKLESDLLNLTGGSTMNIFYGEFTDHDGVLLQTTAISTHPFYSDAPISNPALASWLITPVAVPEPTHVAMIAGISLMLLIFHRRRNVVTA